MLAHRLEAAAKVRPVGICFNADPGRLP